MNDIVSFVIGGALLLFGVYLFASGNQGTDGGDGGDETAVQNASAGSDMLTADQVYTLAQQAIDTLGVSDITPAMVTAIAWVESSDRASPPSFDPAAVRQEPRINDASYGLMQVLAGTARWLSGLGYDAVDPSSDTLLTAEGSMYFGCAYLHWLRNYKGQARSDDFVVGAYNGGPGNPNGAGPQRYLASYQQSLSVLGFVA